MPKSQYIDPKEMRKAGEITFSPIPVNQYKKTAKEELKSKHFTKDDLKRIYRDMVVIREFETMLQLVKTTGGYNGVEYNNPGPAHLSAGQEAAAVGMAYMLDINDFIFGSHRSHGEILAKGLRAIELLDDKSLEKIMNEFWDGATVNVAKRHTKAARSRNSVSASCCTAHWPKFLPVRPDSTKDWASACTPSSRRSASTRTTPS